ARSKPCHSPATRGFCTLNDGSKWKVAGHESVVPPTPPWPPVPVAVPPDPPLPPAPPGPLAPGPVASAPDPPVPEGSASAPHAAAPASAASRVIQGDALMVRDLHTASRLVTQE
ncbi:MAG TPA: hypothetical protein ENK57_18305, partial [Polyangiaceae bacterium]|nr:hypothetical protein [Polyangiaceae bacterium]